MSEFWFALNEEETSLRIAVTLLHFLWQGIAIGALVFLSNWFLRQASASSRYALHGIALFLMPLCVVLTFAVADVPDSWRTARGETAIAEATNDAAEVSSTSGHLPETNTIAESPSDSEPPSDYDAAVVRDLPLQANPEPQFAEDTSSAAQPLIARWAPEMALLYFVGAGLFFLRLVLSMWGGQRLRTVSTPVDETELLQLVAVHARRVGLRILPAVRYCERVSVPVVVGVLRPVILLPASLMTGLGSDQLSAVICHELAHIRRNDLLLNLLQRVVESTLFFHPVVWYVSRRMSIEREICCDDLVVSSGYQPMEYAGALLRMAELCSHESSVDAHALAASGNHPSQLESRIWRLIHMNHDSRFRMTRVGTTVIALLILFVLGMPAVVHSLAQASQPGTTQTPRTGSDASDETPASNQLQLRISPKTPPVWVQDNVGRDPFTLDNRRILTGTAMRDVNTGKVLKHLNMAEVSPQVMKVSTNRRFLVTCSTEPTTSHNWSTTTHIEVWDLVALKKIGRTIDVPAHRLALKPSNIAVSSDGKKVFAVSRDWLATGLGPNGVTYDAATDQVKPIQVQDGIAIWDVATGEKKTLTYSFSDSTVSAVALSPDDQWLVIADKDKLNFRTWKTEKHSTTVPVGRHVVSLAFSQDSRYLAEGPRASKGDIQIRDMRTLKIIRTLKAGDDYPMLIRDGGLTFTRDGKRLIAGNAVTGDELKTKHRIHVWDVTTGVLSQQIAIPLHQVWSLTVTPDGKKIAARLVDGNKSLVAMWELNESEADANGENGIDAQKQTDRLRAPTIDNAAELLQGEWEYVSVERNGEIQRLRDRKLMIVNDVWREDSPSFLEPFSHLD